MPTYAPDLVVIPCKTGIGVAVDLQNAALYGRHYIPQPFQTAGIIAPELWGNFTFGPATVGIYYREQWYIENQNHPLVYTLVAGTLPTGLLLTNIGTTAQGQLAGTPTVAGTYDFTLRATGPTVVGDQAFEIIVDPAPAGGGLAGGCGGG